MNDGLDLRRQKRRASLRMPSNMQVDFRVVIPSQDVDSESLKWLKPNGAKARERAWLF